MGIFMLFPLLLGVLFWGTLIGGGGYLLLRVVRALEARSGGGPSGALADRVRTLEDALLRMEGQMEELAEQQRFTTRLLADRTGGAHGGAAGSLPGGASPEPTPDDAAPGGTTP